MLLFYTGWGMCNDNAYGLAASSAAAKMLGVDPPVSMQNDFSLIDRRAEGNVILRIVSFDKPQIRSSHP